MCRQLSIRNPVEGVELHYIILYYNYYITDFVYFPT